MPLDRSHVAQLVLWTKKFAKPLFRSLNTNLQKISATDRGELLLSIYKPQDDRSLLVLSMKKGESGVSLTHSRPVTLKQPNSFVQMARKYIQGKKIIAAYASISPICLIFELAHYGGSEEDVHAHEDSPNAIILDLDHKPPRLILAKKTLGVPSRYEKECAKNFLPSDNFFESWCEWSEENTKTKKRAAFLTPFVCYCPIIETTTEISAAAESQENNLEIKNQNKEILQENISKLNSLQSEEEENINHALSVLPTHIRKPARTKLQFFERRIHRQKFDLPTDLQLERLKKQSENLKQVLYLWPKDSLTWYVPPQFIEEHGLNPIYTIKKGEKPSSILTHLFHEIDVLERRKQELQKRIIESENALTSFHKLLKECAIQIKIELENYLQSKNLLGSADQDQKKVEKKAMDYILSRVEILPLQFLCKSLDISLVESEQIKKIKQEKEERLPYRSYVSSTGQFIRVARSAADGDKMLKLMPSNHFWLHVLTGEGSHVWLEKLRGEKKVSQASLREAAIIAIHHSKHSRAQSAEVQFATRADIEKKKNLAVGKVLVRRCETFVIRYDNDELKKMIGG